MQLHAWLLLASVMAACIPLPSTMDTDTKTNLQAYRQRMSRAIVTARRQPSFLYLLGQFFGQTISDTSRTLGNITRTFNDQFTTTTPSPQMVTEDSNSTTEQTPAPITREQLFTILGNNYRGLVRLFNQEWSSAVEQSSRNIGSFRKELREAIRPFLAPNRNNTRNQT